MPQNKPDPTVVLTVRERIQDNLITLLDSLPDEFISQVCDMVVEEFKVLTKE